MTTQIASAPIAQAARPDSPPAPMALARVAGVLYLVIAVAAGVAHMGIPSQLVVPGDATETARNILSGGALFRIGIASEYAVLLSEVVLSALLYILLRPAGRTLALVAAAFRLTMTAIHGANMISSFLVLRVLESATAATSPDHYQLMQLFLDAHSDGFAVGIVFFIPHVLILGYLIFTSGYLPRFLGVLFVLAGLGYLIDSAARLFAPGYGETPALVALLIAAAEVAFPLWLLARGVEREGWRRRVAALR